MAKYAYRTLYGTNRKKIDAADLSIHDNETYYCTTPECNARMFVRSPQKIGACFVSYNVTDHTGGVLCHIKDKFKPDHYEENLFCLETFFTNLLTKKERNSEPHHGSGGIGSNKGIAISTLRMLYLMCVQFRDGGSYNNYSIDDILIDKYNYDKYHRVGINGNRIIACTFFRYDRSTNCIFMNCPDGRIIPSPKTHKYLKIHVTNDAMFEKCLKKLIDPSHQKITVLAGNWTASEDKSCIAECEIVSVGKQICKGD